MSEFRMNKRDNLHRIIRRFFGNDYVFNYWLKDYGIVRASQRIGCKLWFEEIPEDCDTRELRRQLNYLDKNGQWDFEGDIVIPDPKDGTPNG